MKNGFVGTVLAVALLTLGGCSHQTVQAPTAESHEIVVFAAASLTEAFNEIGKNLAAANDGVEVTFNFAGSQQLAQQIAQGAPCDVFASANKKQMDAAVASGRIDASASRTFVRNRLVVI